MLSEMAKNLVPTLIPLSTQSTYSSWPILMLNYLLLNYEQEIIMSMSIINYLVKIITP